MINSKLLGESINIGTGKALSIKELVAKNPGLVPLRFIYTIGRAQLTIETSTPVTSSDELVMALQNMSLPNFSMV